MNIIDLSQHVNDRTDARGWMVNFIQSNLIAPEQANNIHLGTVHPGAVRGNHYHEKQEEWIFIFGGKAEFVWKEDGEVRERVVEENDRLLFNIKPGITHSVRNLDKKDIYLMAVASQVYDKDTNDSIKDVIL